MLHFILPATIVSLVDRVSPEYLLGAIRALVGGRNLNELFIRNF
jgi:hypothetical protein